MLTRNWRVLISYVATIRMAEHHDGSDAEHRGAIFETGDNLGRRKVAGKPADEKLADSLVEHQFDRHTGIGAREHSGERMLFIGGPGTQRLQSCP